MYGGVPLLSDETEPKLSSECRKQSLSSESPLIWPIVREFWENDNLYRHFRSQSLPSRTTCHQMKTPDKGMRVQTWLPYLLIVTISGETDRILPMPEALERRFSFLASESRDHTPKSLHRNAPASCSSYWWPKLQWQSVHFYLKDSNN